MAAIQRQREVEATILRYIYHRTPSPVTPQTQGRGVTLFATLSAALRLDNHVGHMAIGSLTNRKLIATGPMGVYLTAKGYEIAHALAVLHQAFG